MRGSLRGAKSQIAELRVRRSLAKIAVEALVKPGGAAEHAAGLCQQKLLRLQLKAFREIADQFGQGRGAIFEERTGRSVTLLRSMKQCWI